MSNGVGPLRSMTVSPRGYSSLHRPTIVVLGASYEVELPSIDAEFSGVAQFTGWRSAHPHAAIDVDGKAPSACMTFFERYRTRCRQQNGQLHVSLTPTALRQTRGGSSSPMARYSGCADNLFAVSVTTAGTTVPLGCSTRDVSIDRISLALSTYTMAQTAERSSVPDWS